MRILPTDLEKPDTRPILATVITATLLHLPNISVVAALLCVAMWSYHALSLRRPLPVPVSRSRPWPARSSSWWRCSPTTA
jgi:hypothetical protein